MPGLMNCVYGKPSGRPGVMRCALGLYGGRPYDALCAANTVGRVPHDNTVQGSDGRSAGDGSITANPGSCAFSPLYF
jgi:hypothetical protein